MGSCSCTASLILSPMRGAACRALRRNAETDRRKTSPPNSIEPEEVTGSAQDRGRSSAAFAQPSEDARSCRLRDTSAVARRDLVAFTYRIVLLIDRGVFLLGGGNPCERRGFCPRCCWPLGWPAVRHRQPTLCLK